MVGLEVFINMNFLAIFVETFLLYGRLNHIMFLARFLFILEVFWF